LPFYEIFFKTLAEPTERRPNLMPPKADPYATPVQRRIDALLIVITAITVAILLLTGSRGRAANDSPKAPPAAATHAR